MCDIHSEPRSHESDAAIKGISTTNKFLVQWFHMFNMNKLLVECDDVLSKELASSRSSQAMSYHIDWLSFAHLYNLRATQRTLAEYIGNALANASASRHVETFKVPDFQQLAPLIGDIDRLWQAVRTYFSREFWERNSKESLLSNPLFGDHLNTLMENKRLNNRMVEETRERLVAGLGMEERRVAMESMLRRGRLRARAEARADDRTNRFRAAEAEARGGGGGDHPDNFLAANLRRARAGRRSAFPFFVEAEIGRRGAAEREQQQGQGRVDGVFDDAVVRAPQRRRVNPEQIINIEAASSDEEEQQQHHQV